MSCKLQNYFLWVPLPCNVIQRKNKGNYVYQNGVKVKPSKGSNFHTVKCAKKHDWISQGIKFTHSYGENVEQLWKKLGLQSRWMINSVKEPLASSKTLVRSMAPLWEEGLFLIRCSIFCAVMSGLCLLMWYGQLKAKSYVEARLLPRVCALLSDHIQREFVFGKVRRISPLSITLESCSIGPHSEEFSCGEVPIVKLRILPFSSLRRGKIVVDAVLSNPSLLIAQKKNYTWLGIPYYEGTPHGHLSTEEGIDYRTRTRRVTREEALLRWESERDNTAREAAENGYIISEANCSLSEGDILKESASLPTRFSVPQESFFYMDDKIHQRDHHCMDAGVEYDLKHADLEKAFGAKIAQSRNIWSKIVPGAMRHRFKRRSNGRDLSMAGVAAKRRILERSASAARAYFRGQSRGESGNFTRPSGTYGVSNLGNSLTQTWSDTASSISAVTSSERDVRIDNQYAALKNVDNREAGATESGLTDEVILELENKLKNGFAFREKSEMNPTNNTSSFSFLRYPFLFTLPRFSKATNSRSKFSSVSSVVGKSDTNSFSVSNEDLEGSDTKNRTTGVRNEPGRLVEQIQDAQSDMLNSQSGHAPQFSNLMDLDPSPSMQYFKNIWPLSLRSAFSSVCENMSEAWSHLLVRHFQRLKSEIGRKVEDISAELVDEIDEENTSGIDKMIPLVLDSVHFKGGTLMLLAYGDMEPREMEAANGHVKFQNHYGRVHVQLSGSCKMWRSDTTSNDGGWLSTDVYVDTEEQKWHANLKIANLFVPLFERILELPITWSNGRASGEVHICMSRGETFPNLHGQLDVTGLAFHIYDAPSHFSEISASLCFRAQRIFLHNARGWFGDLPLEASGDFGIHPEEGEYHLMCQVPSVEVNALMKTFKMKPLLFPLAGSVTAIFNCQGPLDTPTFVGSALVSRKLTYLPANTPESTAYEAMMKNKEAGAVAAIDRIPFSYISANFTFNTDNCVADLYGIRATLVDGGEIRGAGNAWICPEGEVNDTAMDVNFSGNLCFDKIMRRYVPGYLQSMPLNLGDLIGETKLSGSLLRPRFDIKWTAPKAEGSFSDARGDIIISHDYISVNSSSVAFELCTKILTSYPDENWLNWRECGIEVAMPFSVEGIELDLRMRNFEFFNFVSSHAFDSLRPVHLKATGRVKFQGKVNKISPINNEQVLGSDKNSEFPLMEVNEDAKSLSGDVSISGLKLNQLMLAPQLAGVLSITSTGIKLDATGRPDENLAVEIVGPLQPISEENIIGKMVSFSLQKGHLKANACYQPLHLANLEVRHLPLDELEIASLRGAISRAELQLNFQKRRGHGALSVLRPKFSGVLGEALDVAARWSGDVITLEKAVLEQSTSKYELQGEYVLPGSRDRNPAGKEKGNLFQKVITGHLGSMISSMGRWRMRLEVPKAEIAEMLPLARLLSRSSDPAVQSRSKDFFIQSLQSVGLCAEDLQKLLEVLPGTIKFSVFQEVRGHCAASDEVVLDEFNLPGLAELKGSWRGSLDASGGGNGDTMAEFDFNGEEWEWGAYKTQRVLAAGAYSNNDGLRLEKIFIQRENATIHADGTLLGPKTNLHFAVLNFPVGLVPTVVQVIETSATDAVHSLRQLLAPIKGILHMEGDLRGNLAKPECDVQVRLLDGAIGGVDLGRAEIVASLTSTSRFLFNAKFEPIVQNGHVHIQGSIPVTFVQNNVAEEENAESDKNDGAWVQGWGTETSKASTDEATDRKGAREINQEVWDTQMAENLRGLNWNILDVGEVRIDADIKDGGMMLLTALSPHAKWLHGNAEIILQVRGTVEQPVLDGSASFHRATVSSPVLWKPLTNFGGTVLVNSNRLCISSLEGRISRKGKLYVKGNLPLRTSEASLSDKLDLKCEVLEVRARNILSGQVDTQLQITGSITQPNISGNIKISHGEAYLPHDKGSGTAPFPRDTSNRPKLPGGSYSRMAASKYVSRFLNLIPATSNILFHQPSGDQDDAKELLQAKSKPKLDVHLTDLRIVLGPELRIVYPLILNFAVSGELELNGLAHPKLIKPKGILAFENGDINLVATQVRLKREHLNIAKFEPENGLDPMLDLALVGSEWQFRIQSRASKWQEKLVVTSTRSVEQDVLSPTENIEVQSSEASQLIPQHNYKLDVHALNSRHPGEFECREFRESILGVLPHRWDLREDTLLKLAHFRRHKRKILKKTPGKTTTNYPFHKPEEKHSPGKDVTKKVSNVIEKAVNIAKSAKTKKHLAYMPTITNYTKLWWIPNVIVAHHKEGIEAVHLASGRTLCKLHLQEGGLHADINGDGVLDHVQVVGGNGAEQTVVSGSMEVLRPCWAIATSGVPVREQLFNASVCHHAPFNLFQHGEFSRSFGRHTDVSSLEVAAPIFIQRNGGRRHREEHNGDVVFLTNRGEVTSYSPGFSGHDAIWNWQLLTGATWSNLPSPSGMTEARVVPTLKPFPLRVHDNQELILVAGDQEAVVLSPGGSLLASVDLPSPPTHALVCEDFSNDGLTDLILVTSNGVYGFVQTRQPGALFFSTLVGCLIIVMGVLFVSQYLNSNKGKPRASSAQL